MKRLFLAFAVSLLWSSFSAAPAYAQAPEAQADPSGEPKIKLGKLSFGFVTGFYQPSLDSLNTVINDRNQAILEDPNFLLPSNPNFRVEARNIPAGDIGGAPWVGLETQWELSESFAVRLTGGVWKGERIVDDSVVTFLRSNLSPFPAPRSARYNLTLNQIFLDWRYYLFNEPDQGRLSVDLGVLGMTQAFLTLDSVVRVVNDAAPGGGFASVSSSEAQGTAYTSRYGMTGEYFLGKRLVIGLSAHYILGTVGDLELTRFFPAGFPEIPVPEPLSNQTGVPLPTIFPTPNEGESLSTAPAVTDSGQEIVGTGRNLKLELEGLEVSGYLRFYF